MGELLTIIVNWVWANFLEPIFRRLEPMGRLFLSLLLAIGYIASKWISWFNFEEKLLGASSLFGIGLIWFVFRRLRWNASWKLGKVILPLSIIKLFLPLLLIGIGGYTAYLIYQNPFFSKIT